MALQIEFTVDETSVGGVPVLVLCGEADVVTAPGIKDRLADIATRSSTVVVDMANLSFIDSTALGVLVVAGKRFARADGEVRLAALQPHIRKVFDITGLDTAFPIHPDVESAVAGADSPTH